MPHLHGRVKVTVTGLAEDWEASLADLKTIHLDKVCEPYVEKFGVRGIRQVVLRRQNIP